MTRPRAIVRLPMPHAGQRHVRTESLRFNWLNAGRRWRKTSLVMAVCAESMLHGKQLFWGAPTVDQVRIAWREFRRAAAGVFTFIKSEMTIETPNGGRIVLRTLDDPDNARGHTADGVVLDEAAFIKPEAWYDILMPVISDTGGWLWAMSTPNGRNWYWQEWTRAHEGNDPQSIAWQAPTLGFEFTSGGIKRKPHPLENPFFSFRELVRIYKSVSERTLRQEYGAEFTEDGGGVFRGVRRAARSQRRFAPEPGHTYVAGLDWAQLVDFTVLTVIDVTTKQVIWVERFNQIDYDVQLARIAGVHARYKLGAIVAERNSIGVPLTNQARKLGLPIHAVDTTNTSKSEWIEALTLVLEQDSLELLAPDGSEHDPAAQMIDELLAFAFSRLPSGLTRYSAPEGQHDDCVVSLLLAWQAALNATPKKVTVGPPRPLQKQVQKGVPGLNHRPGGFRT